ncbi:unnamed protein product [Effrenium voratum]|uniref:Uncharacterized protein n=1 Tax=Effrenium voratum TaxID=2562239 RepID=A0AA36HYD0_9DINO|nr:unnamed protein product [Effrenium voratum]CAJ1446230.1 unnamed protein product [Effrenium voratum]
MRATSPSFCKRNCSITSGSHGQAHQLQVGTQTWRAGGHLICSEPRPFGQPLTPKAEQAGPLCVAVAGYVRGPAHFAELAQGFSGRCLVANPVEDALRHGCPLWVSLGAAGAAVVLGQSFGALVARSLASRWEAMGREVRGIVLFDSRNIPRYLWRGDVCQSAVRNLQAAHFRLLQEFHFQAPFAPPHHSDMGAAARIFTDSARCCPESALETARPCGMRLQDTDHFNLPFALAWDISSKLEQLLKDL